ncbi:MAG: hypothetical protein Q9218_003620 [Villophora microphyllina]
MRLAFSRLLRGLSVATRRFLLISLPCSIISLVDAVPALTSNATLHNTSNPRVTSEDKANSDRNSPFQVLADGTQDLAALVGIFATDSVERYSIDYTKGYLSAASATLSLLGLLGYVRALVKLGLGSNGCHNAGFDTRAFRPLFGVPDHDRLPSDVLHDVHYVERTRSEGYVTWNIAATRRHTVDTLPILDLAIPLRRTTPNCVTICACRLTARSEKFYLKHAYYRIPFVLAVCSGLTSFAILALRGGLPHQTWTMFYATFGLFISLLGSSTMWAWVYAQEQLPKGNADWVISRLSGDGDANPSVEKQDHFAFTGSDYSYCTFDLKAVKGWPRRLVCAASLTGAVSAIIGYICQYVEVRRTTPAQAVKWLAIQGAFAVLRVAIWIGNPSFDDFFMERGEPGGPWNYLRLSESQLVLLWFSEIHPKRIPAESFKIRNPIEVKQSVGIHEVIRRQHARPPNWESWNIPNGFKIPMWALHGLDHSAEHVHQVFELAQRLRNRRLSDSGPNWDQDLKRFQEARRFWDMPGWLFMLWVDAHTKQDLKMQKSENNSYGCRLIEDIGGTVHFMPFWTSCDIYRYVPGDESGRTLSKKLPIQVFGDSTSDERSIYARSDPDSADAALLRKQDLYVGRRTVPSDEPGYEKSQKHQEEVVAYMDDMWRHLDAMMDRARNHDP